MVSIGVVVGDLDVRVISRYGAVPEVAAEAALVIGAEHGLIAEGRVVDAVGVSALIDLLSQAERSALADRLARSLAAGSGLEVEEVARHCRSAGSALPASSRAEIAGRAADEGKLLLGNREYARALIVLQLAVDLTSDANPELLAERMLLLVSAVEGTGDVDTMRDLAARVVAISVAANLSSSAAWAAVRFALPSDWFAGDPGSIELIREASTLALGDDERIAIDAARGLVEMRVPIVHDDAQQYAWVTRPDSAQPVTEQALVDSEGASARTRALALLAWRATHRAPAHLERRRVVSAELVPLAQTVGDPWTTVMAAEFAAVDAIESGQRSEYDRLVAMSRWTAERDGNPRLRWRSLALSAGAAYLDGDVDSARRLVASSSAALAESPSPCWVGAEIVFFGQEVLARDDVVEMESLREVDSPAVRVSPFAQAALAYVLARTGDTERAGQWFERSWRALDAESSVLLHMSRLSAAAIQLGASERMDELVGMCQPFVDHVVVDAHGWWVDGPVARWMAALEAALGRTARAIEHIDAAVEVAGRINDVRSLSALGDLAHRIDVVAPDCGRAASLLADLDGRERQVLELLVDGLTNPQIAERLAYSLSTIRDATVSIYRKLGVRGRVDAVKVAVDAGVFGRR